MGPVGGLDRKWRGTGRGAAGDMSENQRRAEDVLTIHDVVLRGMSALGLIVAALAALLAAQSI